MEWLEKQAIATAPVECKPKLWKRYVDDVLDSIKRGQVRNLTDHINSIDPTGNIKFTYEEEDKQIPFLDQSLLQFFGEISELSHVTCLLLVHALLHAAPNLVG